MSFWRQEPPVIENGVVVKGGMFPHQLRWWNSTHYMRALVTGYGGGKTLISGKRAISMALHNPSIPYMYVSPSYKQAKRTIVPTLIELLDGKGIAYRHNKTDHEFQIKHNGRNGIIWIGSGDDPDALKGPNLCGANIDEPFIQNKAVFEQVMARIRDSKAKHRELTLTGTPEELNWGYDICEGEHKDKYDLEVIEGSTMDNLANPQEYIDSLLAGYDKDAIDAYVHGKFTLMGDGVIYRLYSKENQTERTLMPGDIHWTHDFNYYPMSSAICQIENDNIFVVDEIVVDHADATTVAKEFVERYDPSAVGIVYLYGDPTGKAGEKHGLLSNYIVIENILRAARFTVERKLMSSCRSIRDSQSSLKARILNGNDERRFFINPTTAPTADRGMKTAQTKKGSTHLEDDTNRNQHITTALRYMAEFRYPILGNATMTVR